MKQFGNEAIKTSVIIITRNRAKMLANCLNSLVAQTRMPDEVIVVDNASTDKTRKVIPSFKKRLAIRYVQEKQIGMPYAQNKGIQVADGTLLLMLDDDCIADNFWVEGMEISHKKYPKAWAIQGRTISLPRTRYYSLVAEFNRFLSLRNYTKGVLSLKSYLNKNFRDEIKFSTCDGNNFSIKTSYLKKHKLLFDENFYRGLDTDLGRQIMQKNGLIMFCPRVQVDHWERSTLKEFLEQRWHIGRTAAKIADKWRTPSLTAKIMLGPKKLLAFLLFCKASNQLSNLPILLVLLFLDRLYYLNGYFFEKKILSLDK